ncbi:MAG: hypothetical protein WAX85_01290 [Minisyncoccia bacterium]
MQIESTTRNSGDLVERDSRGRFLIGHRKLGGKVSGSINFNTKLIRALNRVKNPEVSASIDRRFYVEQLLRKAIVDGNVKVMAYIWERVDGKPK